MASKNVLKPLCIDARRGYKGYMRPKSYINMFYGQQYNNKLISQSIRDVNDKPGLPCHAGEMFEYILLSYSSSMYA
jgi:hypothetical protein